MNHDPSAPGWETPEAELAAISLIASIPPGAADPVEILDGLRWTASLYRDTFVDACKHVVRVASTWDGWRSGSVPDALAALCTTMQRGTDTMVVLTCSPKLIATKTIKRQDDGSIEKIGFGKAKTFEWHQEVVEGIHGVHGVLKRLVREPRKLVIRADPVDGIPKTHVTRRIYDRPGEPAHFKAANPGRRWVCFDFDAIKPDFYLGEPPTRDDLKRAVSYARSLLPAEFHGAACVYRWSSSAGLDQWTTISLHLWFWLSRPVACRSIRDWAEKAQIVDASLFSPAQAHYTADPIFDGVDDPLGDARLGMLEGVPEVFPPAEWLDFADYQAAEAAQQEAFAEARKKAVLTPIVIEDARTVDDAKRKWCGKALENLCGEVLSSGKGNRHPTAHRKAVRAGTLIATGFLDRDVAERALYEAITLAMANEPSRWDDEARNISEGIDEGLRTPADLSHVGIDAHAFKPKSRPPRHPDPFSDDEPPENQVPEQPAPTLVPMPAPEVHAEVTTAAKPPEAPTQGDGLREFCAGLEQKRIYVEDVVKDSPVKDHEVPPNYWMTRSSIGLWKNQRDTFVTTLIAHSPVLISARFVDANNGSVVLMLAWRERGRWVKKAISRGEALQKTKVVKLAEESGFPVTSESAGMLAKYLGDYEARNAGYIRGMKVTSSFGWQKDNGGFVWGKHHISPKGQIHEIVLDDEKSWVDGGIAFKGIDEGDKQFLRALRAEGSFTEWRNLVRELSDHPRALFAVFVSLCTPLLEILGCPNFAVDWGYRTSSGKSTAAAVAASVWGRPNEMMTQWSATRNYIERTLELLGSIPIFMDDTKQMRRPEIVVQTIYMVANGKGDGRANTKRTDATREWRTVMLSSGEQPATSFDNSGGTRPRCLEVTRPAIEYSTENALLTKRLVRSANEHFGHAGPRFVAWLLERRDKWPEWKERYRRYARELITDSSGAENRIVDQRALLTVCFELASEALNLEVPDPIDEIWPNIADNVEDAAGEERAMDMVRGWFASRKIAFRGTRGSTMPHGGWLGAVIYMKDGTKAIAFYPHALNDFLEDCGFSPPAIVSGWRAADYLLCDGKHATRKVGVDGVYSRMYVMPSSLFVPKSLESSIPGTDFDREDEGSE